MSIGQAICPHCSASLGGIGIDSSPRSACPRCGRSLDPDRAHTQPGRRGEGPKSAVRPVTPTTAKMRPEQQFGRYRILRKLGEGGMGSVYLAIDTELDRRVALKVPTFDGRDDDKTLERFYREARTAAKLEHPELCRVYDVGKVGGTHYLTMPFIEGRPLSDAISPSRPLAPRQVAAAVRKLALAMDEAHRSGIIHRDLKPSNIMVTRKRELIVMDFGLARSFDRTDPTITRSGELTGTPLYMAPEQLTGEPDQIGPACDIYSLGVILYELLTARRPFEGPAAVVLGLVAVAEPPPPSRFRDDLDPLIERICLKALAKSPTDRFQSMAEFAAALGEYLKQARTLLVDELSPDMATAAAGDGGERAKEGTETLYGQFAAAFDLGRPSAVESARKGNRPQALKPPAWRRLATGLAIAISGLALAAGLTYWFNRPGTKGTNPPLAVNVPPEVDHVAATNGPRPQNSPEDSAITEAKSELMSAIADDAEHRAMHAVLNNNGALRIFADGREHHIAFDDGMLGERFFTIRGISFCDVALSHDAIEEISALVPELMELEEINLRGSSIENSALAILNRARGLKTVRVSAPAVNDAGLLRTWNTKSSTPSPASKNKKAPDQEAALLQRQSQLRRLSLRDTSVSDAGIAELGRAPNLVDLDLSASAVSDAALKSISALENLERLCLDGTATTDEGLIYLYEKQSIKQLHLAQTDIGDLSLPILASLSSLRELDITGTFLSERAIARLKASLPQCQISFGPGANHDHRQVKAEPRERIAGPVAELSDREAATWIQRVHGSLRLVGSEAWLGPKSSLPQGPLKIKEISFLSSDLKRSIDDHSAPHLAKLDRLEGLDIRGTAITGQAMRYIAGAQRLKKLIVSETDVDDYGLKQIAALKSLEGLWLHNTKITNDGLVHLQGLSKLKELLLSATAITDQGVELVSRQFELNDIELRETRVTDKVIDSLNRFRDLHYLNLSSTQVTDEGISRLKRFPHLRRVTLTGTSVGDQGVQRVCENTLVRELLLGGTKITDAAMASIGTLNDLDTLDLEGTNISDPGFAFLFGKNSLEKLNLKGTRTKGLSINTLKPLPGLKVLELPAEFRDRQTLGSLQAMFPNSRITREPRTRRRANQ
jgi:Leucine-rich repeat (LRR) protein